MKTEFEIGSWVVSLDENFLGSVVRIEGEEVLVNFGSDVGEGWEHVSNLKPA
jgi:hypothetical protein